MKSCNAVITVFNTKLNADSGMDDYFPTVISGVSWYQETASTVDASGLRAANKFTIRIPADAKFSGKSYADPAAYAAGDPDKVFTLRTGDIIVKGAWTEPGRRPADLQRVCGEVVTVLGVTDNRRGQFAPHWKVVGK